LCEKQHEVVDDLQLLLVNMFARGRDGSEVIWALPLLRFLINSGTLPLCKRTSLFVFSTMTADINLIAYRLLKDVSRISTLLDV
jgi:hypothetical protein